MKSIEKFVHRKIQQIKMMNPLDHRNTGKKVYSPDACNERSLLFVDMAWSIRYFFER